MRDARGASQVLSLANGYALVNMFDTGESRLVDLRDGSYVSGQSWAAGTFLEVLGDAYIPWATTGLAGGVVVAFQRGLVTIWYPKSVGLASHRVSLA